MTEECPICMDSDTQAPVVQTMCCRTQVHDICLHLCMDHNPDNGCPFCRSKIEDVPIEQRHVSQCRDLGKAGANICCCATISVPFIYVWLHTILI